GERGVWWVERVSMLVCRALGVWRCLCVFSWSGVHGVFHYLPTRRSSDLSGPGARSRTLGDAYSFVFSEGHTPGLMLTRVALGEEDRKSTRLNSSHVKISYAVFCLKKKKWILSLSWGAQVSFTQPWGSLLS